MLYRCSAVFSVILVSMILFSGCGGGSGSVNLAPHSSDSSLSGTVIDESRTLDIEYITPREGCGLRQEVHYDYDFSAFSAQDGFTVVPMLDEKTPCYAVTSAFSANITAKGDGRKVELTIDDATSPFLHFRYDPSQWYIHGVGVHNPFFEGGYVCFAEVLEPGLLAINACPIGTSTPDLSRVRYVDIDILNVASRKSTTSAPVGQTGISAAFMCTGDPPTSPSSYGNIDFRLPEFNSQVQRPV